MPTEFFPPVELGEAEFDRAVEAAVQSLPGHAEAVPGQRHHRGGGPAGG
ncbi:hypothetical protein [Halomonas halophila]